MICIPLWAMGLSVVVLGLLACGGIMIISTLITLDDVTDEAENE